MEEVGRVNYGKKFAIDTMSEKTYRLTLGVVFKIRSSMSGGTRLAPVVKKMTPKWIRRYGRL